MASLQSHNPDPDSHKGCHHCSLITLNLTLTKDVITSVCDVRAGDAIQVASTGPNQHATFARVKCVVRLPRGSQKGL